MLRPLAIMLTGAILLTACQNESKTDLITIDILEGLKTEKEFRLSEIADNVEYVKLETTPECLLSRASYTIGKKYILAVQDNPEQIFLFDRKGKLLRKIGQRGKGPGEYTSMTPTEMDPDETYILVTDFQNDQLLKFDVEGKFITHIKYREVFDGDVAAILIKNADEIWISLDYPLLDKKNFPLLRKLDRNFKQTDSLYPITSGITPDVGRTWGHGDLYQHGGVLRYRQYSTDTIFSEYRGKLIPHIYFPIRKDHLPGPYTIYSQHKNPGGYSYVSNMTEIKDYYLFYARVVPDQGGYMIYSKKTGNLFLLKKYPLPPPFEYQRQQFLNDLDGMVNPDQLIFSNDYLVQSHEVIELRDLLEKGSPQSADVRFPAKRNEFTELIKSGKDDDNPILQIFHLK